MATEWPPKALATPTVSHKDGVSVTAYSIRINAPARKVFNAVLNVGEYKEWNTWIPEVDIKSQPEGVNQGIGRLHKGTLFVFHVIMDAKKPGAKTATELRVSDVSTPEEQSDYVPAELLTEEHGFTSDLSKVYRVAWKSEGGFVSMGLRTERFHEVIEISENECEVRTWEIMGGPIAYTVKWMFSKTLAEKFKLWCTELKQRSES